jgi:hypothetical protein
VYMESAHGKCKWEDHSLGQSGHEYEALFSKYLKQKCLVILAQVVMYAKQAQGSEFKPQ